MRDYESEDEPLPETGGLSILLDGAGHPQALIEVTEVSVVPFDEVDEEHARREGEGDWSPRTGATHTAGSSPGPTGRGSTTRWTSCSSGSASSTGRTEAAIA